MTTETDPTTRIEDLALTFPCLDSAEGVERWDADALDRWAAATSLPHGELATARFVLAVWNPNTAWRCGRFDIMESLRVWDAPHRAAFLQWAEHPWWP